MQSKLAISSSGNTNYFHFVFVNWRNVLYLAIKMSLSTEDDHLHSVQREAKMGCIHYAYYEICA